METGSGKSRNVAQLSVVCEPVGLLKTLSTVRLKPVPLTTSNFGKTSRNVVADFASSTQCKQKQEAFAQNKAYSTEHGTYERHSSVNAKWAVLDRSYSLDGSNTAQQFLSPGKTLSTTIEETLDDNDINLNHVTGLSFDTQLDTSKMTMTDRRVTSSRRSPPPVVRSRPPLPTGLAKRTDKSTDNVVNDLTGALTSLRSTDFVRKYSRKGKSPSSTGNVTPALYTPLLSPTGYMSPPATGGATGLMTSSSAGNLAANFGTISMIKTRLEQVAKDQNDKQNEGDETDNLSMPTDSKSKAQQANKSHPSKTAVAKNARDRFTESLSKPLPDNTFSSQISETEIYPNIVNESKNNLYPDKDTALCCSTRAAPLSLDNTNQGKTQQKQLNQTKLDPSYAEQILPQENNKSFQSKAVSSKEKEHKQNTFSGGNDFHTTPCSNPEHQRRNREFFLKTFSSFESSEGESVHSSTHPALSSFESIRDSVDDLHLHLSDNENKENKENNKEVPVRTSVLDTDDEGVGPEVENTYTDVYADVTSSLPHRKQARGKSASENVCKTAPIDFGSLKNPFPFSQVKEAQNEEVPQSPRLANGRFLTHPPLTKSPVAERGSVDSNGLGSLRDPDIPVSSASDLTASITSFDSHFCSGESTDTQILDNAPEEPVSAQMGRRNSRQMKQKSKSDPSGGQRLDKSDLTAVVQAHLQKQSSALKTPPYADRQSPIVVNIINTDEDNASSVDSLSEQRYIVKPKTALHTIELQLQPSDDSSSTEESMVRIKKRSSKRRQRPNSDLLQANQAERNNIPKSPSANNVISSNAQTKHSNTSATLSVKTESNSLPRAKSSVLSEEHPNKKHLALSRSHSTASVLLRKDPSKTVKSSASDKGPRKAVRLDGSSRSLTDWSPSRSKQLAGLFSPILKPIYSSSLSIFEGPEEGKTKRELIVKEFHSTEQQFVEALQIMVEKYMIPMKTQNTLDSNIVDTIFYKINEIYMHHATFLAFLERALANWNDSTTIGDVICKTFSKQTVVESYVLFMDNFPTAEKRLDDVSSKSAFQKFTEQVERGINMKLPLKAQIVKPAQRIPRYELLIKRLLENTAENHADFKYLKEAEEAIHRLALRINSVKESKREEGFQETLKKLELLLLTDLVAPDRQYLRHDMVQVMSRKDAVCLWLFTDLLLFSTVKRKSGPVNRKTTVLLQAPSGHDFIDNTKQRLWLRFSLDDIEIIKTESCDTSENIDHKDKEQLEKDFSVLSEMSDLSNRLNCKHDVLAENLHELISQINKELSNLQLKAPPPEANQINMIASTENGGIHDLTIAFPSLEKKIQWETTFNETKSKMIKISNTKPPEFLQALQITKTRAGMQFTCAAVVEAENGRGFRDIWVCNSDGYVGHMCLLSLHPEPIVTLNTPVPGCNSRILCICAIPPYTAPSKSHSRSNSTKSRRSGISNQTPPSITVQDSTDFSEDGYVSDTSTTDTQSDDDDDDVISDGATATPESSSERQSLYRTASESSAAPENPLQDPSRSLMWMGTEHGYIHIFPSCENIKTTKCKTKLQQSAAILCIVQMDNRVYVSLANGDLVVYMRDSAGMWNVSDPEVVTLASASTPINKILCVTGKLWCASFNDIMIVNPTTIETEVTFTGNTDTKRGIQCMVNSGQSVCVSGNGSSKVLIFHASNYELLQEINVAQSVAAQLQSVDDIIRQHKIACLRITSLVTCRDLLWVGTSAGIIVTIPLPKVSSFVTRNSINIQPPTITGIPQGHTGHVRFLTCVEMPQSIPTTDSQTEDLPNLRRRKNSIKLRSFCNKYLIISGGDGFEDTTLNRDPEVAGKDDSMNHLLLWQM